MRRLVVAFWALETMNCKEGFDSLSAPETMESKADKRAAVALKANGPERVGDQDLCFPPERSPHNGTVWCVDSREVGKLCSENCSLWQLSIFREGQVCLKTKRWPHQIYAAFV